ncbi:MAG: HNH endonuclease [Nanoarchaeota archaeon]
MGITKEGWIKRKLNGKGCPWNKGTKGITVAWNKGKTKAEFPQMSNSGNRTGNSWNKDKKLTEEHRKNLCKKKPMSLQGKLSIRKQYRTGKRRPWNKSINAPLPTPYNRKSPEYKEWRLAVFKRDNFQCIWGGKEHGREIEADHIQSVSWFPEQMLSLQNGRTLCVDCHKKTDTWGAKSWKLNQVKYNI